MTSPTQPAQIFLDLRKRIFNTDPDEIGLQRVEGRRAWGVVMETGFDNGVFTLVALTDGTASLYFSNGGGMLGGGQHEAVAEAAKKLAVSADGYLLSMFPTDNFPLPGTGRVRFFILTDTSIYASEASEADLGSGAHPLSPLFVSAHQVITQFRLVSESRQ